MKELSAVAISLPLFLSACAASPTLSTTVAAPTVTAPAPTETIETTEIATELAPTETIADPNPPSSSEPLTPEGPWLVFKGGLTLWVMNAEGSSMRQIDPQNLAIFRGIPSADGKSGLLVYITAVGNFNEFDPQLHVVSLPDLKELALIKLVSEETAFTEGDSDNKARNFQIVRAITGYLEWSPDGTQLAFIGAMEGTSADVYTWTVQTGEITHLKGDDYQASELSWSPDSRVIVNASIIDFDWGGAHEYDSLWATRADGGGQTMLLGPDTMVDFRGVAYEGWLSDNLLAMQGAFGDPTAIDIFTAQTRIFVEPMASWLTVSPSGAVLFTGPSDSSQTALWLLRSIGNSPVQISDEPAEWIHWSPEANLFVVHLSAAEGQEGYRFSLVDESGTISGPFMRKLAEIMMAPDGTRWATYELNGGPGIWVEGTDGSSLQISLEPPMGGVTWSPDGTRLLWGGRDGWYMTRPPGYELTKVASFSALTWIYGTTTLWLP